MGVPPEWWRTGQCRRVPELVRHRNPGLRGERHWALFTPHTADVGADVFGTPFALVACLHSTQNCLATAWPKAGQKGLQKGGGGKHRQVGWGGKVIRNGERGFLSGPQLALHSLVLWTVAWAAIALRHG